jgi:hypothetical protein
MRRFALALAALAATPSLASAQSVLERVLGQIDGASNLAQVNGTYANIAESIGGAPTTEAVPADLSNAPADTVLWEFWTVEVTVADLGKTFTPGDGTEIGTFLADNNATSVQVNSDGSITIDVGSGPGGSVFDATTGTTTPLLNSGPPQDFSFGSTDALVYDVGGGRYYFVDPSVAADNGFEEGLLTVDVAIPGFSTTIDGSINNVLDGIDGSTQEALAGLTSATEWNMPTFDFGDMATTALGAVNTGEITLGVNSAVDEASTSTTNAISAVMTQIGGSADTGALVLNVASNASAVNGSINNTMAEVNGSIGNLSTTALGAVNTGTITSGVDAAVAGIVGMSGQ